MNRAIQQWQANQLMVSYGIYISHVPVAHSKIKMAGYNVHTPFYQLANPYGN